MHRGARTALAAVILGLAAPCGASAAADGVSRAESRLMARAVPDIPLRLADGQNTRFSDLARGKPVLVTFFYRRCSGICTPLLAWVRDAVREVGGLGVDYRVLSLSFDDADTVADVRAQAEALGLLKTAGWAFAVTERDAVAQMAGALDFWYRRDPVTRQFDHPGLVVAIDDGRIVRAFVGDPGGVGRLRSMVWELRGSFIPVYKVPGQTALGCLAFDPQTGATRLDWGLLLLVLPAAAALVAAGYIFSAAAFRVRGSAGAAPCRGACAEPRDSNRIAGEPRRVGQPGQAA